MTRYQLDGKEITVLFFTLIIGQLKFSSELISVKRFSVHYVFFISCGRHTILYEINNHFYFLTIYQRKLKTKQLPDFCNKVYDFSSSSDANPLNLCCLPCVSEILYPVSLSTA